MRASMRGTAERTIAPWKGWIVRGLYRRDCGKPKLRHFDRRGRRERRGLQNHRAWLILLFAFSFFYFFWNIREYRDPSGSATAHEVLQGRISTEFGEKSERAGKGGLFLRSATFPVQIFTASRSRSQYPLARTIKGRAASTGTIASKGWIPAWSRLHGGPFGG